VPKTGQTNPEAIGDDGDLKRGVAWPRPRFTDNNDGTVTDNLTGLVWLENANCTTFFSSDTTGQNNRTWSEALTAVNSFASGYCGLTDGSIAGDWRVPNVREMHSLIHYDFIGPALPNTVGTGHWEEGDPFTVVHPNSYWSGTSYTANALYAWGVHLSYGSVNVDLKTVSHYVWPVRAGH
jgi:hypothetical protein